MDMPANEKNAAPRKAIRRRLVITYVAFYFIPMIIFNAFIFSQRRQAAIDSAWQNMESARTAVVNDAQYIIGQMEATARTVATNNFVVDYLDNYSSDPHAHFISAMWDFGPFLNSITEINPMITSVRIYSLDENIPRFQNVIYPASNLAYTGLEQQIASLGYGELWLSGSQQLHEWQTEENVRDWLFHYTNPNPIVYSLYRKIYSDRTNAEIGYIEVSIDAVDLLAWPTFNREEMSLFFLDERMGLIDWANDERGLRSHIIMDALSDITADNTLLLDGQKYLISVSKLNAPQVTLVLTYPYPLALSGAMGYWSDVVVVTFAGALALFLFTWRIFRNVPGRLNLLVNNIQKLSAGEADVDLTDTHDDEISLVNETLSQMIEHNNTLINTVYKVELAERDAKLSYLEAQIDPHFLFNSLEAIRMSAQLANASDVADALVALSSVLRVRINHGGFTTLKQEIFILRNYVQVENFRLGSRVMLEIIASARLMEASMPSLILQPLAENAVRHGMRTDRIALLLKVEVIQEQDECLLLRVTDNGVGIPQDRLQLLREYIQGGKTLPDTSGNGVGLANIYQRLKLLYNSHASMHIDSVPGAGTQVDIRIPMDMEKQKSGLSS